MSEEPTRTKIVIFNYPAGNELAKKQQTENAAMLVDCMTIACPRDPQGNWPAVEEVVAIEISDIRLTAAIEVLKLGKAEERLRKEALDVVVGYLKG
jgi:hypothetical protein